MIIKRPCLSFRNIFFVMLLISLLSVFSFSVFAYECTEPSSDLITEDTTLCEGSYYLPDGVSVDDGINLNCDNTELIGSGSGQGLILENKVNITVQNCNFMHFYEGIFVVDSESINLDHNIIQNNTRGIAIYSSKDIVLTKNTMKDNLDAGLYLIDCFECQKNNQIFDGNGQAMVIEHSCTGGDNLCPSNCNGSIDYDCQAICGDLICTTEGDCDCSEGEIPLDEMISTTDDEDDEDYEDDEEDESTEDDESTVNDESTDLDDVDENEIEESETDEDADSSDKDVTLVELSEGLLGEGIDHNGNVDTIDFEILGVMDEETPDDGLTVYPIVADFKNNVPLVAFEQLKVDSVKHSEFSDELVFSKVKRLYKDSTEIVLKITPKKNMVSLTVFEYFPKEILKDASLLSSDIPFKPLKKQQAVKMTLKRLKKGEEKIITFTINKQIKDDESYTLFVKSLPKRDWFVALSFVLVILMYLYYALHAKPIIKKHAMYLHDHMKDRYFLIAKDELLMLFLIGPILVVGLFLLEPTLKLWFGLWIFRIVVFALFVVYLLLSLALFADITYFKKRYKIGGKKQKVHFP